MSRGGAAARASCCGVTAEMIGRRVDHLYLPEDRDAGVLAASLARAKAAGGATAQRWMMRKDGTRLFVHGATTALVGASYPGFVKAIRDVTAVRRTQDELVASREKLELATRARLGRLISGLGSTGSNGTTAAANCLVCPRCAGQLRGDVPRGAPSRGSRSRGGGGGKLARSRGQRHVRRRISHRRYRGRNRAPHPRARHHLLRGRDTPRLIGTVQDVSASATARRGCARPRSACASPCAPPTTRSGTGTCCAIRCCGTRRSPPFTAVDVGTTGHGGSGRSTEDRERIDRSIHAVIDGTGHRLDRWFRFRRGDGSYADVRDRGYVLRDGGGRAVRMLGAMLDQTERKREERRLREEATGLAAEVVERRRQRPALDHLPRPSRAGRRGHALSPRQSGLDDDPRLERDELVSSGYDLVHPDDAIQHRDTAQAARVADRQLREPYPLQGRRLPLDQLVKRASGGEIFAIGRDVTEARAAQEALRQTEEALRQSQKVEAVGQLTGGVAHDFNNLLTVIRGSVDLCAAPGITEERRVPCRGDRRHRRPRQPPDQPASRLRTALRTPAAGVRRRRRDRGHGCDVADADGRHGRHPLPSRRRPRLGEHRSQPVRHRDRQHGGERARCDGRGRRADDRSTPGRPPSPIRAHAAVDGGFIAVSITDTGAGIPADRLEQIFEPFFTTKGVGHGTGLGLSQVFGFAKQSHGEVVAESRPGRGATFTLYLPKSRRRRSVSPPSRLHGRRAQGRVLPVVEDNRDVGNSPPMPSPSSATARTGRRMPKPR
ncbi:ATP-binding protein [Sphingomonas sp. MMS24-JH45]